MQLFRKSGRDRVDFCQDLIWQIAWWNRTGRIPRMNASLLDVLHDGTYHGRGAVGKTVHIQFLGIVQKLVNENGMPFGDARGFRHVPA